MIPTLSDLIQEWLKSNEQLGIIWRAPSTHTPTFPKRHYGWLQCKICGSGMFSIWDSSISTNPNNHIEAVDPEFFDKLTDTVRNHNHFYTFPPHTPERI